MTQCSDMVMHRLHTLVTKVTPRLFTVDAGGMLAPETLSDVMLLERLLLRLAVDWMISDLLGLS